MPMIKRAFVEGLCVAGAVTTMGGAALRLSESYETRDKAREASSAGEFAQSASYSIEANDERLDAGLLFIGGGVLAIVALHLESKRRSPEPYPLV